MLKPEPIAEFVVSPHAAFEMERRGIDEATLRRVLSAPDQRESVRPGREVLQSRVELEGKTYLVRVFVDVNRDPVGVVTLYRTTKISKYWRPEA